MNNKTKFIVSSLFVLLIGLLSLASIIAPQAFPDNQIAGILYWVTAGFAILNPFVFIFFLVPRIKSVWKSVDGFMVEEAVLSEGVHVDTLNRSAAIALSKSENSIAKAVCAHCGDIAAPPDKFQEVPDLGISAQFSGQLLHAGGIEYMQGLGVEIPEVPENTIFVALENRLLGYYAISPRDKTKKAKARIYTALAICSALKLAMIPLLILDILSLFSVSPVVYFSGEVIALIWASSMRKS